MEFSYPPPVVEPFALEVDLRRPPNRHPAAGVEAEGVDVLARPPVSPRRRPLGVGEEVPRLLDGHPLPDEEVMLFLPGEVVGEGPEEAVAVSFDLHEAARMLGPGNK